MRWTLTLLVLAAGCGDNRATAIDAGPVDAARFRCSTSTCDEAAQYCYVVAAGAAPMIGCNDLPASCATAPTCACVVAAIPVATCATGLVCTADGDRVTVTCNLP